MCEALPTTDTSSGSASIKQTTTLRSASKRVIVRSGRSARSALNALRPPVPLSPTGRNAEYPAIQEGHREQAPYRRKMVENRMSIHPKCKLHFPLECFFSTTPLP